jgi:translation initiation factor 1
VRSQQRNGRKSLTTVQGLKKEYSYNKILKDLKKEFCCNGTVVQDPELGQVQSSAQYSLPFIGLTLTSLII